MARTDVRGYRINEVAPGAAPARRRADSTAARRILGPVGEVLKRLQRLLIAIARTAHQLLFHGDLGVLGGLNLSGRGAGTGGHRIEPGGGSRIILCPHVHQGLLNRWPQAFGAGNRIGRWGRRVLGGRLRRLGLERFNQYLFG